MFVRLNDVVYCKSVVANWIWIYQIRLIWMKSVNQQMRSTKLIQPNNFAIVRRKCMWAYSYVIFYFPKANKNKRIFSLELEQASKCRRIVQSSDLMFKNHHCWLLVWCSCGCCCNHSAHNSIPLLWIFLLFVCKNNNNIVCATTCAYCLLQMFLLCWSKTYERSEHMREMGH